MIYLKFIILLVPIVSVRADDTKRLLLDDPDIVGQRLAHLEQTLIQLSNTVSTLQTQNGDLQRQNAIFQQQNIVMNSTMEQLKLQNTNLHSEMEKFRLQNTNLHSELEQQKLQVNQIIGSTTGHGSTYIRWGRTQCKDTQTELIYSSFAAGQYYFHPDDTKRYGGPATTLCLPDHPQLTNETFPFTDSLIRGTEYKHNTFAWNSHDEDVPCCMCRRSNSTSSVMIPGRETCYTGWRLEYQGYIASGSETHSASDYICIDRNPEYIPSGKAGNDGHLIYMVGIKCGPLPCPPYEDNRKLPCVVCSK